MLGKSSVWSMISRQPDNSSRHISQEPVMHSDLFLVKERREHFRLGVFSSTSSPAPLRMFKLVATEGCITKTSLCQGMRIRGIVMREGTVWGIKLWMLVLIKLDCLPRAVVAFRVLSFITVWEEGLVQV